MRLERLIARGFRNLDDVDRALPPAGVALVGPNGQGKTNLLEALYYPVLFRSLRGAPDPEVARFGGPGFHVEAWVAGPAGGAVATTFTALGRKKRITVRGEEIVRLADAIGSWLAVAFLPSDVGLAGGPAAERRAFLDRLLALADRRYYAALARYRAALAQRNTALRQERPELARAFDGVLAQAGATVVTARLAWVAQVAGPFAAELDALGEPEPVCLRYHGRAELAEAAAWPAALDTSAARDQARGATTVGPHRDDLVLELQTLATARGTEPALLLDDVFSELDAERQRRLARRLESGPARQVFVTAPRLDELPPGMELPRWRVEGGRVIE